MNTGTKYTVGGFIGVLVIIGLIVTLSEDKIEVSFPDSSCGQDATLRVTKDDFTLKCGRRIAFQADTLVEYYKTYGPDEWVRNNRYVGRNKKDITLSLTDYGDSFDITRTTRYRKGRQSVEDGILQENYKFTKDGVKITYNYEVNNKAKHKISMRIKKQYRSSLDAFDPFGHTGVQSGNLLYYEGFGDLIIDPTIHFTGSPENESTAFAEGDTVPLLCNATVLRNENITNVSLWTNMNGTWMLNETTIPTDKTNNLSVTYSKEIPHQYLAGNFSWNCEVYNGTQISFFVGWNNSINPTYLPNPINVTVDGRTNFNLLNGTGWGLTSIYPIFATSDDGFIYINWSPDSRKDHPDNVNMTWNVSIFGTINSSLINLTTTVGCVDHTGTIRLTACNSTNQTRNVSWQVGNTLVDDYFVKVEACSVLNKSMCVSDTTTVPIEIFDYNIRALNLPIRFSPQPNVTLGHALGQTLSIPFFSVDWFGSGFPTGIINMSFNHSQTTKCLNISAGTSSDSSAATFLSGNITSVILDTTDADPDSIWLWGTKIDCDSSATPFRLDAEILDLGTS